MLSKLSSKMIVATILLVVMCSSAFLYLSMNEHEEIYRKTVLSHLDNFAGNLSNDLVAPLGEDQTSFQLSTKLLSLESYENIKYAIIYNSDWNVLQQYVAPEFMRRIKDSQALPLFDIKAVNPGVNLLEGDAVALVTIGDEEFPLGYLLVVKSFREPLNKSNYDLFTSSLPVALIILVSMIGLSIWLSRRLLAPLSALSEFTGSISSSRNYDLRFVTQGKDEVAYLGKRINAMLSRIESQNSKVVMQMAELEQQQESLEKMANFDSLTELPNRKYFKESLVRELSRIKRRNENLIVLFLDLDNFKQVNDTLGHEAGDLLLIKVSEIIQNQLREGDVLSRLGGDEFLIMLNDLGESVFESGISITERIISALKVPVSVREWEVETGVSVGLADASSASFSAENLIRNADIAMYQAKASGRNTYAVFQQELQAENLRKVTIANALTKALQENEFEVFYQAKVGLDGLVNGFEALIRWHSSFDGFVSPAEFIPVAEKSGKITEISRWVINRVFLDIPQLKAIAGAEVKVSLNISANDIQDSNFVSFIKNELENHQVDSRTVELEITESAYFDNFEFAEEFFDEMRKLGFTIALDDFGTGYSSLSYLTRLKIDTLKIDRAFINTLDRSAKDKTILESIIGLAQNLGLNICAEGVETQEQKDFLNSKNCQQIQGYFYAKPVSIKDIEEVVENVNRQHSHQQTIFSL